MARSTYSNFMKLPTIASGFPLVFASGAHWDEFIGHCAHCHQPIAPNYLRGNIIPWGPSHAVKVYVVDSLGYCPQCELLTPFRYRLHHDMSITGEKNGEWVMWPPSQPSLWVRIQYQAKKWWDTIWG